MVLKKLIHHKVPTRWTNNILYEAQKGPAIGVWGGKKLKWRKLA